LIKQKPFGAIVHDGAARANNAKLDQLANALTLKKRNVGHRTLCCLWKISCKTN